MSVSLIRTRFAAWAGARHLNLIEPVLEDKRFATWPASLSKHHTGTGGLATHVHEVVEIAKAMHDSPYTSPEHDRSHRSESGKLVLAVSAVWHDVGKLDDYVEEFFGSGWVRNEAHPHLPHIVRGIVRWAEFAAAAKMPYPAFSGEVIHCIASHHGRKAWGSPVVPSTREALILHHADVQSVFRNCGINPDDR